MANNLFSSTQQIRKELDEDFFKTFKDEIVKTLATLENGESFDSQITAAETCLRLVWAKYSSKNIAVILESFPRIQRALFGLEENRAEGKRYRDHYIHMFDVFITGSRILSLMLKRVPANKRDDFIKNVLRTTKEPAIIPFQKPYTSKQRLFFMWTLISTFHDIGIPIEHLDNIWSGLNRFLEYFGLRMSEFDIRKNSYIESQLPYFISLMSTFFPNGIIPNDSTLLYDKSTECSMYLSHTLAREYENGNHSVVSAICLYISYINTYLIGHHERKENDLSEPQYNSFIKNVLEHDVSRIALAIALHSIPVSEYPKIFPIKAASFPLTSLLIVCDEVQEAFRHEGITFIGISKLTRFPHIEVNVDAVTNDVHILVQLCYVKLSSENEKDILDAYNSWATKHSKPLQLDYFQLLSTTWNTISTTIERKVSFADGPFNFEFNVYLEENTGKERLILHNIFSK